MPSSELCFLPATELARRCRARELSPVEVVEAVLERIEQLNPILNAYCTLAADRARAAARAVEAKLGRGEIHIHLTIKSNRCRQTTRTKNEVTHPTNMEIEDQKA